MRLCGQVQCSSLPLAFSGGGSGRGVGGGIVRPGEGGGFEELQEEWNGWGRNCEAKRKRRVQRGVKGHMYVGVLLRGSGRRGGRRHLHSMNSSCNDSKLMAHDRNDPTASFPSFFAWVILRFLFVLLDALFWCEMKNT